MADVEIDNFVRKFKSLRDAGYKASLTFDTDLGEVNISLSCKVGRVVPPPSPSRNIYPCTPPPQLVASRNSKRRSPSYYRRQARRKAKLDSSSVIKVNLADGVRAEDDEISDEVDEDTVAMHVTETSEQEVAEIEVRTESGQVDIDEESSDVEQERGSSSDEEETEDVMKDLGEELKALIQESERKREDWNNRNILNGNG